MIPRLERETDAGRLKVEVGLDASLRMATRSRRRAVGDVQRGDERDRFDDLGVEEGEIDRPDVVAQVLRRSRVGVVDELPRIGVGRGRGARAEEPREARDGRVGEVVEVAVGGDESLEGGEAGGGGELREAEEDVRARVEEDGGEFRLLRSVPR